MFSKPKISQILLLSSLMIVFLLGCQSAEVDEALIVKTRNIENTVTQTPKLTPRKTEFPTKTLTPISTKKLTATNQPSSIPRATRIPGETQVSPNDGMVLVFIPEGTFQMGSRSMDGRADYDEIPQHLVNLDAYWMDQTVVTNAMYVRFLDEMGNQTEGRTVWLDAGDEDVFIYQLGEEWQPIQGYEDHPAIEISWYGAQAYCDWVGRRLPSEAEWEKAARGSDGRVYPWGDDIDCNKAQYANCAGGLLTVDSKPDGASPFGILGLSGNTWEWTSDWYSEDYYSSSPLENPKGPDEGETRTLRGGSWEYDSKHLRAANRRNNGPAVSMHDYGFRCVLDDDVLVEE
ncbi:formylglycine-generating enzyme family protein [Chloroflexota bacterium]